MTMMGQLKTASMSSLERKYNLRNALSSKQIVFLKGPYCCGKKFLLRVVCEEFKFTPKDLDILNFSALHKVLFFPGTRFKDTDILVVHHIEWFDKKEQQYILEKIQNLKIPIVFINTEYFMLYYKFRKLARFIEIQIPKPSIQVLECMFPGIPKYILVSQNICTIQNTLMMPETLQRKKRKWNEIKEPENIFQFYKNPSEEYSDRYPVADMVIANCTIRDHKDLLFMIQFRHESADIANFFNLKLLKKYGQPKLVYPSTKLLRPVSDLYYKRCKLIDDSLKSHKSMKPTMDHWFQIMHTNIDIEFPVLKNTNSITSNKARMILY